MPGDPTAGWLDGPRDGDRADDGGRWFKASRRDAYVEIGGGAAIREQTTSLGQPIEQPASNDAAWPVIIPLASLIGVMVCALGTVMLGLPPHPFVWIPAVVVAVIVVRSVPRSFLVVGSATPRWMWMLLYSLLIAWTLVNVIHASELVLTGRDGATYLNVAKGLSRDGDLLPQVVSSPFDSIQGVGFESIGWSLRADGRLYQQFLHAVPAAWAALGGLGGDGWLIGANAVVGAISLVLIFALARWFLTPWFALGGTATVAMALPMVYFSRSTFTEPALLAVVAGGAWLSLAAFDRPDDRRLSYLAGAVLGLATLARIDGWLVGVALATTGLVAAVLGRREGEAVLDRIWLGFLATTVLGFVDLLLFSLPYLGIHRTQITALVATTLIARILTRIVSDGRLRRSLERLVGERRPELALTGFLATAIAYLFLIRPLFVTETGVTYGLQAIERAEGLPVGLGRTYAEYSGWWQAWYLGPGLVMLALAGALVLAHRGAMTRDVRRIFLTLLTAVPSLVYFAVPSANTDHIWVMRRFLPFTIPALAAVAWWTAQALSSRGRGWRWVVGTVAPLVLLVPPLLVTAPLALRTEGDGSLRGIQEVCELVGHRPVLLISREDDSSMVLAQPIRQWCGVPVGGVAERDRAAVVGRLDTPTVILGPGLDETTGASLVDFEVAFDVRFISETISKPPSETTTLEVRLFGYIHE